MSEVTDDTFLKRVVSSGLWAVLLRIVQQALNLARLLVLVKWLSPYEFGLVGIALLTVVSLDTMSQTGFQQALIQRKSNIKQYLDTAWTFSVFRGIGVFIVVYLLAGYAAGLFRTPESTLVIQVTALTLVLQSFANPGVVYFQKELQFRKLFLLMAAGTVVDVGVSICSVIVLRSVWALVFGLIAGAAARASVSYVIHPHRPRFDPDFRKARELFGFGKWIWASTVLVLLVTQGDRFFVGALSGAFALGLYNVAHTLSNTPATEVTHVISQVTFPAYSKLQNRDEQLRRSYVRVLQFTSFFSIGLAVVVFMAASDFTRLFLGEDWLPMVPAMMILALAGLARSVAATAGPLFVAIGRPKLDTKWQVVRVIVLMALIYPLTDSSGLSGASLAVLVSIAVSSAGFSYDVMRVTRCGVRVFLKAISFPSICAVVMALSFILIRTSLGQPDSLLFILYVTVAVLVYYLTTCFLDKFYGYGMRSLIRETTAAMTKSHGEES